MCRSQTWKLFNRYSALIALNLSPLTVVTTQRVNLHKSTPFVFRDHDYFSWTIFGSLFDENCSFFFYKLIKKMTCLT